MKRSLTSSCHLLKLTLGSEDLFYALMSFTRWEIWISFQHFNPLYSQCPGMFLRIHLMWNFRVHFFWGTFSPFDTSSFLIYVDKFSFAKFLAAYLETQTTAAAVFPWTATSSVIAFVFYLYVTSSIITFYSFSALSLLLVNSNSIIRFCKMWVNLPLGNKKATQPPYAVCFPCLNWIEDAQWPIMDRLKIVTWSVIDHKAHPLFR